MDSRKWRIPLKNGKSHFEIKCHIYKWVFPFWNAIVHFPESIFWFFIFYILSDSYNLLWAPENQSGVISFRAQCEIPESSQAVVLCTWSIPVLGFEIILRFQCPSILVVRVTRSCPAIDVMYKSWVAYETYVRMHSLTCISRWLYNLAVWLCRRARVWGD